MWRRLPPTRCGRAFFRPTAAAPAPYLGRAAYLATAELHELWVQVNDFCNLACAHCLVSSGPTRDQGLETGRILDAIDQAAALGAARVFFTGGEPLARPDILDLCRHVITTRGRELVILTNGTLLKGKRLDALVELAAVEQPAPDGQPPPDSLRVQVSLDGSTAEVNDPVRGQGSFAATVAGLRAALAAGLRPTLTATILKHNLDDLDNIVRLAGDLGIGNLHLLWPHRRGRVLSGPFAELPSPDAMLRAVRRARRTAAELGISIDNVEEFRLRLDGAPGVKNDLAGAGWNSLCLYTDGWVYPSASTAGVPELRCGDLAAAPLAQIWRESDVCRELREASVEKKPLCRSCTLKFLCGGGTWSTATGPRPPRAKGGAGASWPTTRTATCTRGWPTTRWRRWRGRGARRCRRGRGSTGRWCSAPWGSTRCTTRRRSSARRTPPACCRKRCWSGRG